MKHVHKAETISSVWLLMIPTERSQKAELLQSSLIYQVSYFFTNVKQ